MLRKQQAKAEEDYKAVLLERVSTTLQDEDLDSVGGGYEFLRSVFNVTDGELNSLLVEGGAISVWAGKTYKSKHVGALKIEIERFDTKKAAAKDTREFLGLSEDSGRLAGKLKNFFRALFCNNWEAKIVGEADDDIAAMASPAMSDTSSPASSNELLREMNEQLEAQLAASKIEAAAQLAALKEDHSESITVLNKDHTDSIAALNKDHAEVAAALEARAEEAEMKMHAANDTVAKLSAEIATLKPEDEVTTAIQTSSRLGARIAGFTPQRRSSMPDVHATPGQGGDDDADEDAFQTPVGENR